MHILPPVSGRMATFAAALCVTSLSAYAATFEWIPNTGDWNAGANWQGGVAPTGANPTDILVFGGDVNGAYISNNNLPTQPSVVNQLIFDAPNGGNIPNSHMIAGAPIAFAGSAPQIVQDNVGSFIISAPIELRAPLTIAGNGGMVTVTQAMSGTFPITKNGSSIFRFGTAGFASPHKWSGALTVNDGSIRFENIQAAIAALRANPVTLTSPTAAITTNTELRIGTLNGPSGLVESRVVGPSVDNENIVVHALSDGTYAGTIRLGPATGTGKETGTLIVRGVGKQTFTAMSVSPDSPVGANALQLQKDVAVGQGATLTFAGNASLAQQDSAGAIVMNGGVFELDNRVTNNANRLRDGDSGSTGIDAAGGGLFTLIGNVLGTSEVISRLQLGSPSNARSGALTLRVIHSAGTNASTQLTLQSLTRDGFAPTFATADFSATAPSGNELPLGEAGPGAKISFLTPPPLANGLLRNTRNFNVATVGWATVNGSAFATHGANGIAPVALTPAPDGSGIGDPNANVEIRGNFAVAHSSGYALNSLRLEPTGPNQSFGINGTGNLNTNAILLAGPHDYAITASGSGGIAGVGGGNVAAAARYFHVESATLRLSARLDATFLTLVKAGAGTLELLHPSNANTFSPTVINEGILRASLNTSLPIGEVSFRGGVLEIAGGGVFARNVGRGPGAVNWAGIDEFGQAVDEDEGSGGFAARGADLTIDLTLPNQSGLAWETEGFVNSGHALVFGSKSADRRVIWTDPLSLSSLQFPNYNAREIRVIDNPAVLTDGVRFTGAITGGIHDDLLKTGGGVLELVAANSYLGSTIVHGGTLLVNAPGTIGASFLTEVRNGATLAGNGIIGQVKIAAGGRIAPGNSVTNTGILATGSLGFDGAPGRFSIELGGNVPGTDYDRVVVSGGVTLNGAELSGSLINGFAPAVNDLFFIIINDGSDPIGGTFAQGTITLLNGAPFEISYFGNSETHSISGGNDVVLRFIPEPGSGLLVATGLMFALRGRRRGSERSDGN